MKQLFNRTSCIILSAGNSERMGMHKALLRYDSGRTFIQKITETYTNAGVGQIIVVVNGELSKLLIESKPVLSRKVHFVINDKPELGRFYSLQTGIKHLKTGNFCFFQNIDNPFVSEALLEELILHKNEADVIMPALDGKTGHPVLISPVVVRTINSSIDYEIRIDAFLKPYTGKRIGISDPKILVNINLPADYQKAGFPV